jgi:hypothetical protein
MAEYFILRFFLVLSLVISGYNIQKKTLYGKFKYPYWFAASLGLIFYSLIEGLRYGRATDYFSYKEYFESPLNIQNVDVEFLFLIYCRSVQFLRIPYFISFIFFSFLLLYSCLKLLKQHREVALWSVPLFYLETIGQSENLLRHYAAFSLLIFSIHFFNKSKINKSFLFFLSAFFTHYSIIIVLPFLLWFHKVKNPFLNLYVILSMYIISIIFVPSLDLVAFFLDNFSSINLYENYIDNKDIWLFGEGLNNMEVNQFGIFYYLRLYISPFLILVMGYKLINKFHRNNFGLFYHIYFIGVILTPLSLSVPTEFIYRLVLHLKTFGFLVLAYVIYNSISNFKSINIFNKVSVCFLILDSIYMLSKSIFSYNEKLGFLFVWDNI